MATLRVGMGDSYGLRFTVLASSDFDPSTVTGATFKIVPAKYIRARLLRPIDAVQETIEASGGVNTYLAASCSTAASVDASARDRQTVKHCVWREAFPAHEEAA